jgi:hypothetical protein
MFYDELFRSERHLNLVFKLKLCILGIKTSAIEYHLSAIDFSLTTETRDIQALCQIIFFCNVTYLCV